jgi:hypothetical protein
VQAKWETMWDCRDSQEVGLEAAILKRVRNSSLVKRSCAENVTGLKLATEATETCAKHRPGRGASCDRRSCTVRSSGGHRSENAGMSSVKYVRTVFAESPRVPTEGQSASG